MTKLFELLLYLVLFISIFSLSVTSIFAANDSQFELGEPGILPNSFWYNFEIAKERIVIIFTFAKISRADKLLGLSTERLAELQRMIELKDTKNAQKAIDRYKSELDESALILKECDKNKDKTKQQWEKNHLVTFWQREQLINFETKVVDELKPDINSAISKTDDIINMKCD